jgi:adenylyl-sulfate kinase
MKRGIVLWLTGLSGAGKSTIAALFKSEQEGRGCLVRIVDGDDVRAMREVKLSFSPEDIRTNNRIIAEYVASIRDDHDYVVISVVAPFRSSRKLSREIIGGKYFECYINASIDEVIGRDTKGLYGKALKGEIEYFVGVDPRVPYEPPESPDIVLRTGMEAAQESAQKLIAFLEDK